MSLGRAIVSTPQPSRAVWGVALAIVFLALALVVAAAMPAVKPEPYQPPPWHQISERLSSVEQSVLLLERRIVMLEMTRRIPTGSPTGSSTGSPVGSPIGNK